MIFAGLGMDIRVLNQAVKRNIERFPKYYPYAFTEHGVTMLASILRSEKAIAMNILIVRAFIALREMGMHYKKLAEKIRELEEQYNQQFTDIHEVLEILLVEKRKAMDFEARERIGFKTGKS
jgi:hypothetical protein